MRSSKQDINLLGTVSGLRSPLPTALQAGIALVLVLVAGTSAGFWYEHRQDRLDKTTRALHTDVDDLIFSLEERSYFLAERDVNPPVLSELKRLEGEADDKSRVLNLLSGESVGNTDGFSEYLAALGRRHPNGLWLDRIQIGDGGRHLTLRGLTLHADLLPQFVGALQHEPVMSGTAFMTFTLAGDDAGRQPMRFLLSTGCDPQAATDDDQACLSMLDASMLDDEPGS